MLEKTPPELTGDIYTDGIILSGGLAKLGGFAQLISETIKLRVRVHRNSADCVIMGCGKASGFMDERGRNTVQSVSPLLAAY